MKHHYLGFLTLLAGIAFISLQCKKRCANGFVSVDDQCICPEGKFEGNGKCRELKPNEYYAIMPEDCYCTDTLFMEIVQVPHGNGKLYQLQFDLGWGFEASTLSYIEMPDGDSLYTFGNYPAAFTMFNCTKDFITRAQLFGKFIENDTKIRFTVRYLKSPDFEEEVSRCTFIFHK